MSNAVEDIDPVACKKLFKAVVIQALQDACLVPPPRLPDGAPAKKIKNRETKIRDISRTRDEARSWLLDDGRDFRYICQLAGWEPPYIQRAAQALRARGWQMPSDQMALEAA